MGGGGGGVLDLHVSGKSSCFRPGDVLVLQARFNYTCVVRSTLYTSN